MGIIKYYLFEENEDVQECRKSLRGLGIPGEIPSPGPLEQRVMMAAPFRDFLAYRNFDEVVKGNLSEIWPTIGDFIERHSDPTRLALLAEARLYNIDKQRFERLPATIEELGLKLR